MEIVTTRLPMGSRHTIAINKESPVNGKNCITIFQGIGGQLSALKDSSSKACMLGTKAIKVRLMILPSTGLKLYAHLLVKTS